MKQITFYLDFISPYAYLAFEQLPRSLQGLSYSVRYVPVLFAGMLKHHGQLGPAEIAPKRDWTYRQVLYRAHCLDIAMHLPASHPFNPLLLLRLATACSAETSTGDINRYVAETVFRHVWQGGGEAADGARLGALAQQLAPRRDMHSDDVKAQLKSNTDSAIADQVFGVPTLAVDGLLFWGLDSLPMLRDYLDDGVWFQGENWQKSVQVGAGTVRSQPNRP